MRVFPSIPAAVITGLIAAPMMILGCTLIEQRTGSQLLLFCWAAVAFFVPVFFATVDREFMAKRRREEGFLATFLRPAAREAFCESYLPTWLRMGVWFVSSVASILALRLLGVRL